MNSEEAATGNAQHRKKTVSRVERIEKLNEIDEVRT